MRKQFLSRHKRSSSSTQPDRGLFMLTVGLVIIGLLAVADASAPQAQTYFGDSFFFVKQQLVWSVIGVVCMFVVSRIDYKVLKELSVPLFWGSVIALVLVLIPGIGNKALGARRWIYLGPIGFQPSELVKLAIAIYFARLAETKKGLRAFLIVIALVSGLIMLQPDLGTTLIIASIGLIQLFVSGVPILHLIGVLAGGAGAALVLILTSSYRRDRLLTFLGLSSHDQQGTSYHISQVLIALGSGGLFGVGLGQSRQKYLFLPESATDSVFAIMAEEVGFVGSLFIIFLFLFFLYKGVKIAKNAPDKFGMLLATGIVSWIGVQFFLNLSSMLAITPLTGVPLPFFSYGGSSLTMILIGIGILINISKHAKQ